MSMDLTGINNINEYYTNHYFASVFEENAVETIKSWRNTAKNNEEFRTPWSLLRECGNQYYMLHEKSRRAHSISLVLPLIKDMADNYLDALSYPKAEAIAIPIVDDVKAYIHCEIKKSNGAPLLWIMLAHNIDEDGDIMHGNNFDGTSFVKTEIENEDLITKIFFATAEPPRWILLLGENTIALLDRNKWGEKRYLSFDLEDIFSRREETTLQAIAVLLHKESLCPSEGKSLLDQLDENSHKHASGVSQDLKYALREAIELLGNEVLYDIKTRLHRDMDENPVDAKQLTIECLRYMYRMLFMLFIEARPELGYAPMKSRSYVKGYSLESLRDIADSVRVDVDDVGEGFFLHETVAILFDLIYSGYPKTEEELKNVAGSESLHDIFIMEPLKAHIFDPDYTLLVTNAKIRNKVMLHIIDLMSISRGTGKRGSRGRISYSTLGINQMGAVYEALLSYRGFIAQEILFEVKREKDKFNELDVGYFVPESELENYTEKERVRHSNGKLRQYEKGSFIYRLAGREREKSASYYTPECLTKCLVKYALKELLVNKTADEILNLTICEPAMGSAAFLNEAINQLSEAYLDKKQKELGETISYEKRAEELQRVKMYIADRNVYGIDLNPIAVELAEVSLWLNTICKGGFIPWFSTQLVNGNSLIGARRQCYRTEQLMSNTPSIRWYDNAPVRIMPKDKRKPKKQIYHFLVGDPGMAGYNDKVIKSLASDNVKAIKEWNKKFTKPFDEDDILTLQRLSLVIDKLWEKQIALRKEIENKTVDKLSVYGHEDNVESSHTTIREKDLIYKKLYKSEKMENAGPYARLKFAMDYWCSLWFWPIDKADMLPNRSEFLFDMSLILEGGIESVQLVKGQKKGSNAVQLSLFPTEMEDMASEILSTYGELGKVNLSTLCQMNPRLEIARQIADQNKFFHWELEFADLFETNGGFDLIIGNPPWIKMNWNENAVLSDKQPMFTVKNLTANQTTHHRNESLANVATKELYFSEYESMAGTQTFLNAMQNYADLKGQQTNLYKCFLPQAWQFSSHNGVSAFVHPDGVYDDPKGGQLRGKLYSKLCKHFQFQNEYKLFEEVANRAVFSLNIYSNTEKIGFESISNLFLPSTIDESYEFDGNGIVGGIKNEDDNWNITGHQDRIINITRKELTMFAKLFDSNEKWKEARIPVVHAKQLIKVLFCFSNQRNTISDLNEDFYSTIMWDETGAQQDGIIVRNVHFPENNIDLIYSGPHLGMANPFFQVSKRICMTHRAFDNVDLQYIKEDYFPRVNYSPKCSIEEYVKKVPLTRWHDKYFNSYRVVSRKMLNLAGERTLISAIIPPKTGHIITTYGIATKDELILPFIAAQFVSLPYDFLIKTFGNASFLLNTAKILPLLNEGVSILSKHRALLLNCLTKQYVDLWRNCFDDLFINDSWSKIDLRLNSERFTFLTAEWTWDTPLRTDYERRQALVEIDVLTAMALGMTLEQLKTIYRIQFPVLQHYEANTWYDVNGRIVFTVNRSLAGVGFSRPEWTPIKDAKAGEKFYRKITDDTQISGPIERTIEYVAPFDRCNREQDYDTAWTFFDKKYN